MKNTSN
jgi:photosystem II P680 reaction center D1 protein